MAAPFVALIFLLGCTLTILAYTRLINLREHNTREHLSTETRSLFLQFKRELREYEADLSSISRFYESSKEVTEEEFSTFVEPLFNQHRGFEEILWVPRSVSPKNEEGKTDSRYSIAFALRREESSGLTASVFSHPEIEPLMTDAAMSGKSVCSPPRNNLADIGAESYLLFRPTYISSSRNLDSSQRYDALRGFLIARIGFASIFKPWVDVGDSLRFAIRDVSTADSIEAYRSKDYEIANADNALLYKLEFANRKFEIEFRASQEYLTLLGSDGGFVILVLGLFGSFLLAMVTFVVMQRSEYVRKVVGERTSSLERFKKELEKRVEERTAELEQSRKEALEAVSEVKNAEAQLSLYADVLKEQNFDLELVNKELDEFVYTVSHDLKEPLHGLKICSTFLREDYGEILGTAGCSELDTIVSIVQSMENLMETLLHYSGIVRVDMQLGTEALNEIVDDLLQLMSARIKDEGVEITIGKKLPKIYCHRGLMQELLQNLISNAIKYNESSQKKITIGCLTKRPVDKKFENFDIDQCDIIYVQDNGIGIAPNDQESIFRIFRRLHGRSEFSGGSGAGLTIAKKIVERHHGRIWLDSSVGAGSTFYIAIPKLVS
jgi:signal transduction histidine kinase